MSSIAVGIDGSHNASRALDWAMSEAAVRNAELTVITVHSAVASAWTGRPVAYPGDEDEVANARKAAEAAVTKIADSMGEKRPAAVTVTAINGFPAKTLIDVSGNVDLLVVGSRGGGGFSSLKLGSVTAQVVHHAKCPVVVVPAR